jgi:hypothetical protein
MKQHAENVQSKTFTISVQAKQDVQTTRTFPIEELFFEIKDVVSSIGSGKMMVEFFSAAMAFNVCRYRSCRACGDSAITSAASFRARDEFISPSAAITYI